MNKLLIDDHPIQVLPRLAKEIGLNEAIFVQQLHYWLKGKSGKYIDGRKWIYNTYDGWKEQFPFWSISTIRRTINSCVKQNFVIKGNYNKLQIDNTIWYSINYEEVERVNRRLVQNEQTDGSEWTGPPAQNEQAITIDYPETTTETNTDHSTAKAERIPFKEIIDYLNEQTGRRYSHSANKNQDLIRARWNEGFRVDDFKRVVDTKVKDWGNDSKMNQYLRPVTLFSNKFDDYLNQSPVTKAKQESRTNWDELESLVYGEGD